MLKAHKIPNVIQRRNYFNGIQVFKCVNDMYPPYMSDMLHYANEYNTYNTRNVHNDIFYVPKANINLFKQSFPYAAPAYFNTLPNDVKNAPTLQCFKEKLKSHVINV